MISVCSYFVCRQRKYCRSASCVLFPYSIDTYIPFFPLSLDYNCRNYRSLISNIFMGIFIKWDYFSNELSCKANFHFIDLRSAFWIVFEIVLFFFTLVSLIHSILNRKYECVPIWLKTFKLKGLLNGYCWYSSISTICFL